MKTTTLEQFEQQPALPQEAGRILAEEDGLVCFPCASTYRLAASLLSEPAVLSLLQAKRRSKHTRALVMVADATMMEQHVVDGVPRAARQLVDALWPGNVTMRLPLRQEGLPRKVYKELAKPDKKVGVRLPANPVAELLVRSAGVPLLVSSANLFKKAGASSVAAIKKNFSRTVELFIDAGDLQQHPPSTVLDFDDQGSYSVVRQGSVSEEAIARARAALTGR